MINSTTDLLQGRRPPDLRAQLPLAQEAKWTLKGTRMYAITSYFPHRTTFRASVRMSGARSMFVRELLLRVARLGRTCGCVFAVYCRLLLSCAYTDSPHAPAGKFAQRLCLCSCLVHLHMVHDNHVSASLTKFPCCPAPVSAIGRPDGSRSTMPWTTSTR